MSQPKANRLSSLTVVLSLLPLLIPIAYLIGYFYDVGYLNTYGFSPDAFPKSSESYLVNFFTAIVAAFSQLLPLFSLDSRVVVVFCTVTIVGVAISIWLRLSASVGIKLAEVNEKIKNFKYLDLTIIPLLLGLISIVLPFVLVFLVGCFILGFGSGIFVGQNVANQEIERFSCKPVTNCSTLYKGGVKIAEGKVIAISDKFIGIYTEDGAQLIPNTDITLKNHPRHKKGN